MAYCQISQGFKYVTCRFNILLMLFQLLDLSNNAFTHIPNGALSNLTLTLQTFVIANNQLTSLPEDFCSMVSLKSLTIAGNKFATLPFIIGEISSLRHLNFAYNRVSKLPEAIARLPALTSMNASYNQLSDLEDFPTSLLGKLEDLRIRGNDELMERLPVEMQAKYKTDKEILQFLLDLTAESVECMRMKARWAWVASSLISCIQLMLMGQGGVGKTTLVRALNSSVRVRRSSSLGLLWKKPSRPDIKPSVITHGIHITALKLEKEGQGAATFSVWDMAGQDMYVPSIVSLSILTTLHSYYSTHHLFLSTRAIYLCVFNLQSWDSGKYI